MQMQRACQDPPTAAETTCKATPRRASPMWRCKHLRPSPSRVGPYPSRGTPIKDLASNEGGPPGVHQKTYFQALLHFHSRKKEKETSVS